MNQHESYWTIVSGTTYSPVGDLLLLGMRVFISGLEILYSGLLPQRIESTRVLFWESLLDPDLSSRYVIHLSSVEASLSIFSSRLQDSPVLTRENPRGCYIAVMGRYAKEKTRIDDGKKKISLGFRLDLVMDRWL